MWNSASRSQPEALQPRPFAPALPRWTPHLSFPAYRHLPGQTPHPRTHPHGHSCGCPTRSTTALLANHWPQNEAYLFGVDLYNHAYWWEAHEQWELLWHLAGRQTLCGQYLQALIQTGAALIKWQQGNRRGVDKLWPQGRSKLEKVLAAEQIYMGLDLADFLQRHTSFFETESDLVEHSPLILLHL